MLRLFTVFCQSSENRIAKIVGTIIMQPTFILKTVCLMLKDGRKLRQQAKGLDLVGLAREACTGNTLVKQISRKYLNLTKIHGVVHALQSFLKDCSSQEPVNQSVRPDRLVCVYAANKSVKFKPTRGTNLANECFSKLTTILYQNFYMILRNRSVLVLSLR